MNRPGALLVILAACDPGTEPPEPMTAPDAAPQVDAAVDSPPPEPSPAFTAGSSISGQFAVDDTTMRTSFIVKGQPTLSLVSISLTDTATSQSCGVTIAPRFVAFGSASTSTRQFKTVILDLGSGEMLEDNCHWDDAHIFAGIAAQRGNFIVGLARARFDEDRPGLDIYLNASLGLGGGTASVVYAGAGAGYAMLPDGTVTEQMVEPAPGTLVPGAYLF